MQSAKIDYPAPFLRNMRAMLGGEFDGFLSALSGPPEPALRINPLRSIEAPGFAGDTVLWEPLGRYAAPGHKAGHDLAHFSGAYYMQDASAMAAAAVLRARPGEKVLDLCAAPGGKAGQLAAQLRGQGLLVANEPDAKRAGVLSGNLERLGVCNAAVISALPSELALRWPEYFDAVLVDAPCSGEGMFRRDAAARMEWTEQSPAGCAARQAGILHEAAKLLRPGGRLVYSTCTFNELENECTVENFLAAHKAFEAEDFALPGVGRSKMGMIRLWPHKVRGEGHFVALLRKREGCGGPAPHGARRESKDARTALKHLCEAALTGWPERFGDMEIVLSGGHLYALPQNCPDLGSLRVYRRGLHLCRLGKGYVQPDHALAMALLPHEAVRTADLDGARAHAFVRGEALPFEGDAGWTLACHRGMPLGWGKAVEGVLKNHVPKGIRMR